MSKSKFLMVAMILLATLMYANEYVVVAEMFSATN